MTRQLLGCLSALALVSPLTAEVVDTALFENVASTTFFGDPANELLFFDSTATAPFTLGAITWSGRVTPTEDAGATGSAQFPTFGNELRVRVTHGGTGQFTDLALGSGMGFGPDGTEFTGTSYGLTGTLVNPGDDFSFEFYDDFDDPEVSPDAVWNSIAFDLTDDRPPADVIRFDTTGMRTWSTEEGEPGADYFGVHYGAGGAGPSITNVRLEGHDFFTFWFDLRTDIGIEDSGQFRANLLQGVESPEVAFSDEDPSVDPDTGELLFPNTFGTLDLSFSPGDFGPGDLIRFGVLTQNDDFTADTMGHQMAELETSGPLSITITFDDGTKITAPLAEIDPDFPRSASVDLSILDRAQPTGGDTDGDGDVDGDDLLSALVNFGTRFGALPSMGDVDGQGDTDHDDLEIVIASLGEGIVLPSAALASAALAPAAAVPEPAGVLLLLLGLIAARFRGRVTS